MFAPSCSQTDEQVQHVTDATDSNMSGCALLTLLHTSETARSHMYRQMCICKHLYVCLYTTQCTSHMQVECNEQVVHTCSQVSNRALEHCSEPEGSSDERNTGTIRSVILVSCDIHLSG